jgi:calcineurin-like phosphoesterase family protein
VVVADHYPLLNWPKSHYGSWHVFGHIHKGTLPFAPGKSYNVGVDVNNFYPVSFSQLRDIMAKLPDNHNLLKSR